MNTEQDLNAVNIDQKDIPEKIDMSAIVDDQKPLYINKTLILSVIFCVVLLGVLLSIILPDVTRRKKKKEENKLEIANSVHIPELIIPKQENNVPEQTDSYTDDEILATIPEFNSTQPAETNIAPPRQNTSSGGQVISSRPDTSGNEIQKNISGIKGITSAGAANAKYTSQTASQRQEAANPYEQFGLPSKNEYKNTLAQQYQNQSLENAYMQQNMQSDKQSFFSGANSKPTNGRWNTPFSIWQGTVISATLVTGINTDLPGNIIARVTKNVYSSLDGKTLLIPEGSLLFAVYNSSISYGQNRVQIAWNNLIRPDGFEIPLGNMNGVDAQGYSGVAGFRDEKWFEYVKAAGLVSLFSVITTEMNNSIKNTQSLGLQNLMYENQSIVNKLGTKLIDKALDIQPTIKIKQGTNINVLTNMTIDFIPPLEPYPVTQKYTRD